MTDFEVEVEGGLPLAIVAGIEYAESVARGQQFTFVSDGVVEAAKAWGQNDDITVVTVQRAG